MRRTPVLLAALLAVILSSLTAALPARADNTLLHIKYQRALSATPLDSTLFLMSTTSLDTTDAYLTSNFNPVSVAAIDSGATSSEYTGTGIVTHAPRNLWVVVEITGATQSLDSTYVGTQFSQGATSAANGSSGNQSNPSNWRWYNGQLLTAGGVVENNTSSKTYVFPVPCIPSGPNAWVQASYIRFIIQGDTNAAAIGIATRAWLVNR